MGRVRRQRGWISLGWVAMISLVAILLLPTTARASSCNGLSPWSRFSSAPQVNQAHVFCGEIDRDGPKGFHSRPGGKNPDTIARLQVSQRPDVRGIYGVRWSHRNRPQQSKFSTLFPDRCSTNQVLNSIRYAATHRYQCPTNAPRWARCGANAPTGTTDAAYCQGDNGDRFTIAMGLTRRRDVNTAFPLR